jgi:multidrug efflux pump subunit AcrB
MATRSKKTVKAARKSEAVKTKKVTKDTLPKDKLLSKLTVFFFERARITALLWVVLTIFGALSYTSFMKREGFPSINIPLAVVGGTYFVNDSAKVDQDVAKPISEIAKKQDGVSSVQTQSSSNFFSVSVTYEENIDAKQATESLKNAVESSGKLPKNVMAQYNVPYFGATGGDIEQIDMAISFYSTQGNVSVEALSKKAEAAATWLKAKSIPNVKDVFVKSPFEQTNDPATGEAVSVQRSFDRYGVRSDDGKTTYYDSVIVGIAAQENFDVIKLDESVQDVIDELNESPEFAGYKAKITASNAPLIEENISELQRSLLEGFIAILIVGSIVIAIRASVITVMSMITVVAFTLGFLYLIGYTLNVITLFSLILALALIVDDTIIMVEAIDAARYRHKDRRRVIEEATRKVSRAMVAATLTAALSFAPLLFVGGILGSFIRTIPVTVISALLISLLVALILIPFFARFILLGKKQMGKTSEKELAAGFENAIANFIIKPMLWARHSRRKEFTVGLTAVSIGLAFIVASVFIGRNVVFNIFPPTKDTNGLIVSMSFPPGLDIAKAESIADNADKIIADTLGENYVQGSYFSSGSDTNATEQIQIISYTKRDVHSPELADQLQKRFDTEFKEAQVSVGQSDIGPPASSFVVQIKATNRDAAFKAAADMKSFLGAKELKRTNGTIARLINVTTSSPNQYIRDDGEPIITVSAGFDGDDTSTLVTLAQNAVKEEFTAQKLSGYGLPKDAVTVDLGQEQENQDSFATLALAFPILLVVMYVLLAVQFRSFLQPLLIFMAIPFSLFGITLGLDLTNNAFSFFAMLGFFALLGLSIKNTILLTDFANQARKQGLGPVESAVAALRERFRPLFATSVTAVVSLIPLAITSPFWQGLMVVLIFGLISSTFLVVTVFPYYYLGAEYLRMRIRARTFLLWFIIVIAFIVIWALIFGNAYGLLIIPASWIAIWLQHFYARRLNA